MNNDLENFKPVDTRGMIVPDYWVMPRRKLSETTGHGEKDLYLGSENDKDILEFYGQPGFNINCFISKKDLLRYINESKEEYFNPIQTYKNQDKLGSEYENRQNSILIQDDLIFFNIQHKPKRKGQRIFIGSGSNCCTSSRRCIDEKCGYQLMRSISFPYISYLSIIKFESKINNQFIYKFNLSIDYFGESRELIVTKNKELESTFEESKNNETSKNRNRLGQGKFKESIIKQGILACVISGVTDERLTIACHIKPWKICIEEGDSNAAMDPYNGILLTPTFHKLFDDNLISITDDGHLLISVMIQKRDMKKLGIKPNMPLPILQGKMKQRTKYLDYHRTKFKGPSY